MSQDAGPPKPSEVFFDPEEEMAAIQSLPIKRGTYLSTEQREQTRLACASIISANLERAQRFLSGDPTVKWSPAHIGLFKTLLNKVVPDLPAVSAEPVDNDKPLRTLTRGELQAILNRTKVVQEVVAAKMPSKHRGWDKEPQ